MAPPPLFILCPPRSYSSVICSMIGRHPRLYGFPELLLFVGDSVADMLAFCQRKHESGEMFNPTPPGLLRALAQINVGQQNAETVAQAQSWLRERADWHVKQVLDHLLAGVQPSIGVEKSPWLATEPRLLEGLRRAYPQARYLHLTRHPVTTQRSMHEFFQRLRPWSIPGMDGLGLDDYCARAWHDWHRNIVEFTGSLPPEQTCRLRGEDLLDEPLRHLPTLTAWLGVRGDAEALEAMQHPEDSPYAGFGPNGAKLSGYDPKFQADPRLRPPRRDTTCPEEWTIDPQVRAQVAKLAQELDYADTE